MTPINLSRLHVVHTKNFIDNLWTNDAYTHHMQKRLNRSCIDISIATERIWCVTKSKCAKSTVGKMGGGTQFTTARTAYSVTTAYTHFYFELFIQRVSFIVRIESYLNLWQRRASKHILNNNRWMCYAPQRYRSRIVFSYNFVYLLSFDQFARFAKRMLSNFVLHGFFRQNLLSLDC